MFIKIGLRDLSAPMVACVRIALAAAVLVPVAASQHALGAVRGRAGTVALVGAVQVAAPFLLISLGELEISSALAGILVATAPIFTAVLAIWVDHEERSEGVRLLGIVIGIAGVVALFGLDLSGSGSADRSAASRSCWRASDTRLAASWSSTGSAAHPRSGSRPG